MSALDLRTIARALGGEVQGRQVLAPAPGHRRIDRSLSVRLSAQSPTGFIVHTFSGHDFREARDYVAAKLGLGPEAWKRHNGNRRQFGDLNAADNLAAASDNAARIARARTLWDQSHDAHGTVAEVYLKSRGLELPEGSDVLRFNPRTPWREDSGEVIRVPAMIGAMRQIDGDIITAVHKTRLTAEGAKVGRKMQGKAGGAAIKLDADDEVTGGLHIGEGVETVLAARQIGLRPAWALASAGAIAAFPVLGGIEALSILAENDETNARAVNACGTRWHAAGREVTIIEPVTGSDVNDALRSAANG